MTLSASSGPLPNGWEKSNFGSLWELTLAPAITTVAHNPNSRKTTTARRMIVLIISLVQADRVALAVVAENLLSNAVKFSKPGTTIQVQLMSEPGSVVCTVRDEGPGLSREDHSRLFQKGVTLSALPTGGEASTGFGLALAKVFIDQMGGALWCESEPGHGARFSFRLPAHE